MSEQLKQIRETSCIFRQLHAHVARNASTLERSTAGSLDASWSWITSPMHNLSAKEWAQNYADLFQDDYAAMTNGADNRAAGMLCKVLEPLSKRLSVGDRRARMLRAEPQ